MSIFLKFVFKLIQNKIKPYKLWFEMNLLYIISFKDTKYFLMLHHSPFRWTLLLTRSNWPVVYVLFIYDTQINSSLSILYKKRWSKKLEPWVIKHCLKRNVPWRHNELHTIWSAKKNYLQVRMDITLAFSLSYCHWQLQNKSC